MASADSKYGPSGKRYSSTKKGPGREHYQGPGPNLQKRLERQRKGLNPK
jgi:hypothetical protein